MNIAADSIEAADRKHRVRRHLAIPFREREPA